MGEFKGTRGCGKKGRSGRKTIAVEFNKVKTIEKAWKKVDSEVSKNVNLALPIVLKDMGEKQKIEHSGFIDIPYDKTITANEAINIYLGDSAGRR